MDESLSTAPPNTQNPAADRRRALGTLSALGLNWLVGCGGGNDDTSISTTSGAANTSTSSSGDGETTASASATGSIGTPSTCSVIPTETNGPYPADGSSASGQTLNALTLAGFVRSDIRGSVGGSTGLATGTPLQIRLKLVDTTASCAALAGRAVYIWHCTRDGLYSMYSSGVTGENFLRGVQVSDAQGEVSFTTIFPGCYAGRWPHVHFEIYASEAAATGAPSGDWVKVSQLALPEAICRAVYAQSDYGNSLSNLNGLSLASDNVFGQDQASQQMATLAGSVTEGYTATLVVGL